MFQRTLLAVAVLTTSGFVHAQMSPVALGTRLTMSPKPSNLKLW